MRLTMVLGDLMLDSGPVEPHRCKQVSYLEAMQHCLQQKHMQTLNETKESLPFYLDVESRLNDD
ncbi:MAG TPA: hypothetical protein VMR70_09945 [Flavisolibacter sp.]|nr:hypothetical protein [Flavisolibacter sp.]